MTTWIEWLPSSLWPFLCAIWFRVEWLPPCNGSRLVPHLKCDFEWHCWVKGFLPTFHRDHVSFGLESLWLEFSLERCSDIIVPVLLDSTFKNTFWKAGLFGYQFLQNLFLHLYPWFCITASAHLHATIGFDFSWKWSEAINHSNLTTSDALSLMILHWKTYS